MIFKILKTASAVVTATTAVLALWLAHGELRATETPVLAASYLEPNSNEDPRNIKLTWDWKPSLSQQKLKGFRILRRYDKTDARHAFAEIDEAGANDRSYKATVM